MQKLSRFVAAASAAALVLLPARAALAQGTPSDGTAPAATSPAAPEPKPAEGKPSEGKPSEAKAPEAKGPENPEKAKAASKKKKPARMTRQQEIDRSIDRGTVPARYRNSVPKEYRRYIPFDKQ